MRHLFIVNPAAGKQRDTSSLLSHIQSLDVSHQVLFTQKNGDARSMAEEAARSGEAVRIYACGGDGTLNEVVNGAAGYDNAAITNVPLGTGNDFLKLFGPECKARFSDLAALSSGPQTAMDLIDCNGLLGINIVCAGVDARIAGDVHLYKALPLISGVGAYIFSLVVNVLFKGITRPTKVDMGPFHYDGKTAIICVCNGRYYGGGFMPVGDAMPDDGVLDMLVVPDVNRRTFFRLVGEYAKGRYANYPQYITDYHGTSISFSSPGELVAVVDGEVLRDHAFTVKLSEKKVWFFYPDGLDYRPRN